MEDELKKACEEAYSKYIKAMNEHFELSTYDNVFMNGFKAALKPEHMKHTEEVRGLIQITRKYLDAYADWEMCDRESHIYGEFRNALKPFEKQDERM